MQQVTNKKKLEQKTSNQASNLSQTSKTWNKRCAFKT